jgi:glutamate---cysteine ligase / carboxylate-amine ligase
VADPLPTAAELRATFDAVEDGTVGIEEELMVLDPETLDLAPRAPEVVGLLAGDPRFKLELPAAQLEIVTAPHATVAGAAAELAGARSALEEAIAGTLRIAGSGLHPFASARGPLNPGPHYDATRREHASVASRQLVFGLHVHVAVAGADRALAVHNALRSYLPLLAAFSANAPFHDGIDSGLATLRPRINNLMPRQGIPPVLASWDEYAAALRRVKDVRRWWWELRLHPSLGTVEVRAPDAQITVADTAAVAAAVHAVVTGLAARLDAGEPLALAETWRIEEDRWSAGRHGLDGDLCDLERDVRRPARELADEAFGPEIAATAPGGAERQRAVAAEHGLRGLVAHLADAFVSRAVARG